MTQAEVERAAQRYARFARDEAVDRSPLYAEWAAGIATDAAVLAILARIPERSRQPPLVFAVARMLGAPLADYPAFAAWMHQHAEVLVAEASRRSLQTNEPLRCAVLVPALAGIEGPIALLEVGASAGLCLYPDRYEYRYRGAADIDLTAPSASAVVLDCELRGPLVPPLRLPEVVWRAGIDLAPRDAAHPADRDFLTGLVWPGETGRAERITSALDVVAADPPLLVAGDASDPAVLSRVAALAPEEATLVVTTPGVLPHIPHADRERLIATVRAMDAVWISIDPPGLAVGDQPLEAEAWDGFVLRRDGVEVAACDPLGAWLEWRAG